MVRTIITILVTACAVLNVCMPTAHAQCPTDNTPCEWKQADPIRLWLININGTKDPKTGKPCSAWFDLYVCYRCCSNGQAGMEMKLNYIVPVREDGTLDKDWTRGCEWKYDTEFWKQVDQGVAQYGFQYGKYVCEKGSMSCVVKTLPSCKDGSSLICTYYKANCMRYVYAPDLDETKTNLGWRLVPCDGAGECKQVWEVCCDDLSVKRLRLSAESTGGCYRLIGNDENLSECFPTCWK